jgi:hypothetical protein
VFKNVRPDDLLGFVLKSLLAVKVMKVSGKTLSRKWEL